MASIVIKDAKGNQGYENVKVGTDNWGFDTNINCYYVEKNNNDGSRRVKFWLREDLSSTISIALSAEEVLELDELRAQLEAKRKQEMSP